MTVEAGRYVGEGAYMNELYEVVGTPITGMAHTCK
jgi:hypothetical protein